MLTVSCCMSCLLMNETVSCSNCNVSLLIELKIISNMMWHAKKLAKSQLGLAHKPKIKPRALGEAKATQIRFGSEVQLLSKSGYRSRWLPKFDRDFKCCLIKFSWRSYQFFSRDVSQIVKNDLFHNVEESFQKAIHPNQTRVDDWQKLISLFLFIGTSLQKFSWRSD